MVYFIENENKDAIKIGYTEDLDKRVSNLQVSNPTNLSILYIIPNADRVMEKHIHEICQLFHVRGEWFDKSVIDNHLLKHPWFKKHMKSYPLLG